MNLSSWSVTQKFPLGMYAIQSCSKTPDNVDVHNIA